MSPAESAALRGSLQMTAGETKFKVFLGKVGNAILFLVTSLSLLAVLFIFYFIAYDALPFLTQDDLGAFFFENSWYPQQHPPEFGAASLFYGTAVCTIGATLVAVPLGVSAAICLSDILPFWLRQLVKPVIEILASIPSVAYGFFASVIFATYLQNYGGALLSVAAWIVGLPVLLLVAVVLGDLVSQATVDRDTVPSTGRRAGFILAFAAPFLLVMYLVGAWLWGIEIISGKNALNASIILGIMALPTVVSVSEDSLQAVGIEIRQGSYGLGATRAETLLKAVLPAASSGILAAIILGIMRAVGETMVVWMASGHAAQIPEPFWDILQPVRTVTATIASHMGETQHNREVMAYSVLFTLALCLLVFCFVCNVVSEWVVKKNRRKLRGEE